MVLTLTLEVSTPAFANQQDGPAEVDIGTATRIPGYPDFEITDRGYLIHERDVILGKCGPTQDFGLHP